MEVPLTGFEIEVLNAVIPTQILNNPETLQFALRDLVNQHKEHLMKSGNLNEQDFKVLQTQTAKNIFQFLRAHGFFYEREAGTFLLTEKIKHLKQHGTLEKYNEWLQVDMNKNAEELRIIEARGYLDKDQNPKEHRDNLWKETKSLDYDDDLRKNHPPLPSHKFSSKSGEISGRGEEKKRTLMPVLIALALLALVLLARYLKLV